MIKFYVDEQVITLKVNKVIASDTINFVQLNFVFCPVWEGLEKIVQFTQETRTYSVSLGTDGTTCYLPNEITDGLCAISVFGFNDNNQRITTVPYQVRIRRSGFMEDGIVPDDVQLSVYEQIIIGLEQLDELSTELENHKKTLAEHSANLKALNAANETQTQALNTIEGKLLEQENELAEHKQNITYLNSAVETQTETLNTIQGDILSIKEEQDTITETITGLNDRITALEEEQNSQNAQISYLEAANETQTQTLNTIQGDISSLQTTVENQEQNLTYLNNANETQTETLNTIQSSIVSIKADIAEIKEYLGI